MSRFISFQVISVCALIFCALTHANAEPPPQYTRRFEPYFPPGPPLPEVSPETGLPLKWSTVGPEPFYGNPYLWGGGYGWGAFGGFGYHGGALGAYAPFGYGYGGSGYAYPRGPYWSAYRFGPYGFNSGYGDPRYGANFAGPYSGFYGPAQRVPGYRTYGPYHPPADAVVVPGMPQPQVAPGQVIAPGELPVPAVPQGP